MGAREVCLVCTEEVQLLPTNCVAIIDVVKGYLESHSPLQGPVVSHAAFPCSPVLLHICTSINKTPSDKKRLITGPEMHMNHY